MNATTTRSKTIKETYRNPLTFGTNSLKYYQHCRTGNHVVVHYMHPGEDLIPNVWQFETVEEARVQWRRLRGVLMARGYTEKV